MGWPCDRIRQAADHRLRQHRATRPTPLAVKAALALQNKDLAIHTRDRIAEDGTLTHFTFTVGQPRGRKSDDSE